MTTTKEETINKGLESIKKDTQASWAWFLEYHDEESMIASKRTNQKWFQNWKYFFDITLSPQKRKGKPEIIKKINYTLIKKYVPNIKDSEDLINLNKQIILLIKEKKSKNEIFNSFKDVSNKKIGLRLSKLVNEGIIKRVDSKKNIDTYYNYPKKHYRLGLKALFEYAKQKSIEFEPEEKNIIMWMFDNNMVRYEMNQEFNKTNFIEAILKFYLKYFYLEAVDSSHKKYVLKIRKKTLDMLTKPKNNHEDNNINLGIKITKGTKDSMLLDKEISLMNNWTSSDNIKSYSEMFKLFNNHDSKITNQISNKFLKLLLSE